MTYEKRDECIENLMGDEEFAHKFITENAQTFVELLDRKAGPAGDASIVASVRKLEREFYTRAERKVENNIADAEESARDSREDC